MNGPYGPYIKHAGKNYRIPKGSDPAALGVEDCKAIISGTASKPSGKRFVRFKKK